MRIKKDRPEENEEQQNQEQQNQERQNEEQIKAVYGEADFDISLPDIPMPEPEPEKKTEVKDEIDVAFNFAFIGAGQGGSRIAETFHQLGYRKTAAINTATQDLNTLKLIDNKLCIGDGGAGKEPRVAEELFNKKSEDVLDFMKYSFGEELDRVIISLGAGGGIGAGMMEPLVYAAQELQESVKA